jgi:hypothetical protein
MKLKKIHFTFKKPTVGQWIWIGVGVVLVAFITYIVIRLIPDESPDTTQFVYYEYKEPDPSFDAPQYILENDNLKFELDPNTTHFTVTQKATGRVWYSNPQNAANDSIALPKEKNYMDSTLLLTFSTENGVTDTYDSSSFSVQRKFYQVTNNGDSIQVDYIVGDVERTYIIPMALTEERMDTFTDQMSNGDKNLVLQYYRKYDIDNLTATDNEDQLLAKYPVLNEDNVYVIRDTVPEYMKEKIESVFKGINYTYEDYQEDLKMYSGANAKEVPMFNVTILYKLDGNSLDVEIPFDKISCKKAYPLTKLSVLPYMGASGTEDKGFLFVPEGGGALIDFNNGKNKQNAYYSDIYGWDYCLDRDAVVNETRNNFPVFGVAYSDSSFISILEKGVSYAGINADVSGRYNSVNNVYAAYKMIHSEQYDVSSKSNNSEFAYEASLPEDEEIAQRYTFVNSGSYVDMAHAYRDYLVSSENLARQQSDSTPAAVEIVGAVDKIQQVAGFPKSRPFELTTYEKTGEILNALDAAGFKNMYVRLSGFVNGGIKQKVLTKVKFIKCLGGKSEFKKLAESQAENHKLYLDGMVQYAKENKVGDGFLMYRDSARFVSSELTRLYEYSPIWYGKDKTQTLFYLVRPDYAARMTEHLVATAEKYGVAGVSFRDNGKDLSADYNEDRRVSREQVKNLQRDSMKSIKDEKLGIMVTSGNDYSLQYADCVTDMDYRGTKYLILDETVPFYQLAIHGYVNYTGKAVNLAPDANEAVLDAAAFGGGLYFVFTGENAEALQDTMYTEYYGSGFDAWKDYASKLYARYNGSLAQVFGEEMTDYKNINAFVSKTVYSDGTTVYVNRGNEPYVVEDGTNVPAEDYVVQHASAATASDSEEE